MLYVFYYLVENTFVSMLKVIKYLLSNCFLLTTATKTIMYRGTCVDEHVAVQFMYICD